MLHGKSARTQAGYSRVLILGLVFALAPSAASAASRPSHGDLSPRLAELSKPSVTSASPARQAKALSLPAEGPGSLLREGNRVLVEVRFARGAAAAVDDLRATGAKIVNVSPRYQTVTIAAKPSELRKLSDVPRVSGAVQVLQPIVSESTCPSGAVVSEGEGQLHAGGDPGEARDVFGVDGTGVTVGILSDSFDQATEAADGSGPVATHKADDVASGDLPGFANTCPGESTPVEVVDDPEGEGTDEGRAMAQVVHDLAPGADLAFASAFAGETAFAENIERLAKSPAEGGEGAAIVVDDVSYPGEPFFQEGPIAVAAQKATEAGAAYLSAAGNNNIVAAGNQIGSWEATQYRNSGGCPQAVQSLAGLNGTACMDFNPGPQTDRTLGIKVAPGGVLTVDLQWNEPWFGVDTDLDAFLLDANGNLVASSAEDNPSVSKTPLEFFEWENTSGSQRTVQLVVNRFSGSGSPRLKAAFLENGSGDVTAIEYPRSSGPVVGEPATDVVGPTVFGHNGAAAAITVGAVPFSKGTAVEKYSSRGPVTHYFGPVTAATAAPPLGPAETLSKPEIAATDCGQTTFFAFEPATEPVWRFCGTSAAAPHAAAVAALMQEAKEKAPPNEPATPAEIRAALLASAVPVSEADQCAVGTGLVEAISAIEDLLTPPPPVEPECDPPLAEVLLGEAQAAGGWGSESPPPPPSGPSTPSEPPTPEQQPPPPETDRTAPTTSLLRHPPRVIKTRGSSATARFSLGSNEAGAVFVCRIDNGQEKACPAQLTRRFRLGSHVIRVSARDAAGNADRSPVVFRFRVEQIA